MTTRLYVGAQLDRPPGPKYVESLIFAELAPKPPLPKPKTLAGWRGGLPEGFVLSLVAPRAAVASRRGPMRFDEELEAGLGWFLEAAAALDARVLVVPTEADITTGQRDRDRLAAYFDRIPRDRVVVWAPSGLWEPDQAHRLATKLGIQAAFDPLEDPVPPDPIVYGRMRAIGGRQRFTEGMLMDAFAEIVAAEPDEAFVAIESPRSFKEATRLVQIATGE